MKTSNRLLVTALSLFFVTTGFAMAQQGPPSGEQGRRMGRQHKMAKKPIFTEEQKTKMAELRLAMQKKVTPLKADIATLKADLKLQMTSDNPNMKKIQSLNSQISDVKSQIALHHIENKLAVRELLTPEQRRVFDLKIMSDKPMKHARKHGMHGRKGKRGKMHQPG